LAALIPMALADGGAAPFASGYALTASGLFRFTAQTAQRWRSDELLVPLGGVTLWSDGAFGRLGYADGTILSLPSRVLLSESVGDAGAVSQYAQLCGQT